MAQGEVKHPGKMVVIGGSAGSLEVLLQVLPQLHVPLPYPTVIVIHRKVGADSPLVDLLSAKTKQPVREVEEKEKLMPGVIYVAPADYHLLFEKDGTFSLDASEKVNYSRPSIDVVFGSAAEVYGEAVTAILLSGANADGTEGFSDVKNAGGITIAQDPDTAEISFMPQNAITNKLADHIFDANGIIAYMNSL